MLTLCYPFDLICNKFSLFLLHGQAQGTWRHGRGDHSCHWRKGFGKVVVRRKLRLRRAAGEAQRVGSVQEEEKVDITTMS